MTVIIVGAGIIGCATAFELSSRGARVHVHDPRGIGHGATRASAGMLAAYLEGHSQAFLDLSVASLGEYDAFIAHLGRVVAPPEYDRAGSLQVAYDAEGRAELEASARGLAATPVAHRLLDGSEARRLEPALTPDVIAALEVPAHGYVAIGPFTAALADAARRQGATFSTEGIEAIEVASGRGRVRTAAGQRVDADTIVLAAGSWSSTSFGSLVPENPAAGAPVVTPMRGQLLALRAAWRPLSRIVWGPACYMVPWQDGSVLVGATMEDVGFDERATVSGVRRLLDAGTALLPVLREAAFEEVRVGLRPKTPDELPIIGRSAVAANVIHANGHFRNGVLLAPLTALAVADLVMDGCERPELALTRPARFGL